MLGQEGNHSDEARGNASYMNIAEQHVIGRINNEEFVSSAHEVARENHWTQDKAQTRVVD